jgi:hypothetical protein
LVSLSLSGRYCSLMNTMLDLSSIIENKEQCTVLLFVDFV